MSIDRLAEYSIMVGVDGSEKSARIFPCRQVQSAVYMTSVPTTTDFAPS